MLPFTYIYGPTGQRIVTAGNGGGYLLALLDTWPYLIVLLHTAKGQASGDIILIPLGQGDHKEHTDRCREPYS